MSGARQWLHGTLAVMTLVGAVLTDPSPAAAQTLGKRKLVRVIREIHTQEVRRLTGPDATVGMGHVAGADLGHMFDMDGILYMVFGDTYGPGSVLPPGSGRAVDWRSNTMVAIPDWRRLPFEGLAGAYSINDRVGHARELLPSAFARAARQWPDPWEPMAESNEITKIPTNSIAVNGRMFLHYFSVRDWGNEEQGRPTRFNYASMAYSDDRGQTWRNVPWGWSGDSNFCQVAFVRHEDYIYVFGIPASRFGGVKLARVEANKYGLLYEHAYEYWGYKDGKHQWIRGSQAQADATTIIPGPVGELSVLFNPYLNRWIMMYGSTPDNKIMVRESPYLTSGWSAPKAVWSERGAYGSYMHPLLVENNGEAVYFTMSRWGSYQVHLMKARFVK
jgi:hypothetical protein